MYGNVYSHFAHISRWLQRAANSKVLPSQNLPTMNKSRAYRRLCVAAPACLSQAVHGEAVREAWHSIKLHGSVQTDPISADMAGCVQFLAIRIVLHVPEAYYEGRVFQAVGQALQIVHVVLAQCFAFQKPFILICSANESSNIYQPAAFAKCPQSHTIPYNPA